MLSYMLPVEEKSPSVTAANAAAAARNLSLNLNSTTTGNCSPGPNAGSSKLLRSECSNGANGAVGSRPLSGGVTTTGKVIKSAIKTNHRYHLVSCSSSHLPEENQGRKKFGKRNGSKGGEDNDSVRHNGASNGSDELSDEHTSLLGGGSKSVKSDKNFNNLILVNGNGNVNGKLASVLKNSSLKNGGGGGGGSVGNGGIVGNGGGLGNGINGGGPLKVVTASHGHNGYSAVNNCEYDDEDENEEVEEEFDLVAANNRKNIQQQQQNQQTTINMSTSASVTRNLNGINGNQRELPQQQSSVETPSSGIIVDTSDADSEQTAVSGGGGDGGSTGGGGKKVKMNKLGGSKNVTLKRVSFGSSKGSMVETLVFETPTPLPEHAEREFFHSPAVLAGAGTTVNNVHHYHHLPHYHHPPPHHHQSHSHSHHQHNQHQSDGSGSSLVGLDDSGIELQEEVERSKVRVSFFQSSKPQSISPPESLIFGGQNLIHFGSGGGGGGGGYDNNNSLLDSSYITSAALNQQYDSLLVGHNNLSYNPDDPASMAAVLAYDRQMSTESGWDNPFRPGGDLSREADEIVNLIKGGKPITPTGDQSLLNGSAPKDSSHPVENGGTTVVDGVATKLESTQLQSSQPNGTKSPQKDGPDATTTTVGGNAIPTPQKNGTAPTQQQQQQQNATSQPQTKANQTQISNQVIPGPQSASHVVIDEKKKKKCACCVIQ
ncbi:uncharacterized protein LOC129774361 [Toxorhynchites rutilus septentrionalis]|uniref:uncharacterized protein LOC129774361 n=1 Tax=Toxorhynchites rutilus septentrionalis TaxID=329112 RepID=UPI00247A60EE|nr:uncharacterized protein LOC129774361 [Toxorhynchites rutilus septentrionalis]